MMKTNSIQLGILGLGLGALLSSCVVETPAPLTSSTVTTYRTGHVVDTLPTGYRSEVVEGTRYYNYNGTYYRPHTRGYVVVEAPRAYARQTVITTLPSGHRPVTYRNTRYYEANGRYYRPEGSGYVVVERPY